MDASQTAATCEKSEEPNAAHEKVSKDGSNGETRVEQPPQPPTIGRVKEGERGDESFEVVKEVGFGLENEQDIKVWRGKLAWRPSIAVGLANLGNTCYLNATLQALFHCTPLVAFFSHQWPSIAPQEYVIADGNRNRLTNDFADLIREVWKHGSNNQHLNKYVTPAYLVKGVIKAVPTFSENGQQDAQETFVYLLNCLHDELAVPIPAESHPARKMLNLLAEKQRLANLRSSQLEKSVTSANNGEKPPLVPSQRTRRRSRMNPKNFRLRTRSNSSSKNTPRSRTQSQQGSSEVTRSSQNQSINQHNHSSQQQSHNETSVEDDRLSATSMSPSQKWTATATPPPLNTTNLSLEEDDEFDDDDTVGQSASQDDGEFSETSSYSRRQSESDGSTSSPTFRQLSAPYMQSIISDCFLTLLVQTVTCRRCNFKSYTLEEYLEMSLALPSKAQIKELRKLADEESGPVQYGSHGSGGSGKDRGSGTQQSFFSSAFKTIRSMVGLESQTLSLRECLQAFFAPEQLIGEDQYHCEKCNSKQDAVKSHCFAHLPEILTFNLKRFNRGIASWSTLNSSKNGTFVTYPLRDLDLFEFFFQESEGLRYRESIPHPNRSDRHLYDLFAVVKHTGGINNGHYLGVCKNPINNRWYEYDDDLCVEVEEPAVQTPDAYLLFYRKRMTEDSQDKKDLLLKALKAQSELLLSLKNQNRQDSDVATCFIPTYWSLKWDTVVDPGACGAFDLVCEHGKVVPVKQRDVHFRLFRVTQDVYDAISESYMCGPHLEEPEVCGDCTRLRNALELRREKERSEIAELSKLTEERFFLLYQGWVRDWTNFVKNCNQKSGRGSWLGNQPPGPISNHLLFEADGITPKKNRKRGIDYIPITKEIWEHLHKIYGGGPTLYSSGQELYALQPVPKGVRKSIDNESEKLE